jgi:hypothetical protein
MSARHGLRRSGVVLASIAVAALLVACAAPGAAPPSPPPAAAAAPVVSKLKQEDPPANLGAVERYAWQAAVQLGQDYEKGDIDGFLSRVSRGFYRGYPALESALRRLVNNTTSRSAVVAVRGVTLEGDRVSVRAQWERRIVRLDGVPDFRAGETVFHFLKSETSLRLLDFRGDVPFAIEGIPALP